MEVCKDGSSGTAPSEPGLAMAVPGGSSEGGSELSTPADAAIGGLTIEVTMAARDTRQEQSPPPWLRMNHPPARADRISKTGEYGCDLNNLPGSKEDEVSGRSTPFFAPITPDKTPPKSEKGEQKNYHKEGAKNASPEEGGQNPGQGSVKTPQRKARRKKHRPKVVKEGKQKRTQRMTAVSTEKPPVKRKYVRRKNIGKFASPADQMTGEPSYDQQNQAKNMVQMILPEQQSISSIEKRPNNMEHVQRRVSRKFTCLDDQTGESNDQHNPLNKTYRKAWNFDKNDQLQDDAAIYQSVEIQEDSVPAKETCRKALDFNKIEQLQDEAVVDQFVETQEDTILAKETCGKALNFNKNEQLQNKAALYQSVETQEDSVAAKETCRKTLNFYTNEQLGDEAAVYQSSEKQGDRVLAKETCRKALNFDENEQLGDKVAVNQSAEEHKDGVPAETSTPIPTEHSGEQLQTSTEGTCFENHNNSMQTQKSEVTATEGNIKPSIEGNHQQEKPDAYFQREFPRFTHVFVRRLKSNTALLNLNELSYSSGINPIESNNSSEAYQDVARTVYPEVQEETKIEAVLTRSTTEENKMPCNAVVEQSHCLKVTANGIVDSPQIMSNSSNNVGETRAEFQGRKKLFDCVRMSDDPAKQNLTGPEAPTTCMEALLTDIQGTLSRKKRTKKEFSKIYSIYSSDEIQDDPNLYGSTQSGESTGNRPSVAQPEGRKCILFIDTLVKKLEHLDINKESNGNFHGQLALICHDMANQERAIAIYNRGGPIIPAPPKKKRRPRPKVELDDETTRVWKLLLKNIDNEGIDGTDEDKERWWEEERRVFKGRADSFIARMHLVQGDRRFSPWKGSVVDSVVGVFLTQNVSDHLSSSAFISLASRFPAKFNQECYKEATGTTFYDHDALRQVATYPTSWTHYLFNQRLPDDQHPVIFNENKQNEETEFTNNNGHIGRENCSFSWSRGSQSLLTGLSESAVEMSDYLTSMTPADYLRKDPYYLTEECLQENGPHSSPSSNVTSQNSEDYMSTKNASKMGVSLYYNSEGEDFHKGSYFSYRQYLENATCLQLLPMPSSKTSHGSLISEVEDESPNQNQEFALRTPSDIFNDLGWPGQKNASTSSAVDHIAGIMESSCSGISGEDISLCQSSKNEKPPGIHGYLATNRTSITTTLPYEIIRQSIQYSYPNSGDQEYLSLENTEPKDFDEELDQHGYNRWLHAYAEPLLPGKPSNDSMTMITQGTGKDREESACWEKQGSTLPNSSLGKHKETPSEAKSRRTGRKFKDDFDWDSLRKRAEITTGKRIMTPNTMDSVNWEAVRAADVNAIADAIRDRGMNNVLAERIQDFLNRLVKEHGSIDLEWLRDIQPDEAKEYLLSIRGLGLKSVECVRLLTLHHLAFPVDTNVGRIAVRLGWVPLQPLPESLQLHLLELYPVLESIQKYLWPRLCKLDQRTLYELHYQMITFGKVFCTKSKPNCNACPMRGECRHFASAFASARLALPGPQEKSMVVMRETRMCTGKTSPELPLAITSGDEEKWATEIIKKVTHCQPIVEEPASPEPEEKQTALIDIEDLCCDTFDEIPTIKLDLKEFSENIQNYMHQHMNVPENEMSKALVALNPEAASIPVPKLKNMSRLRTEHLVYEIPEEHPLMNGLEKLEVDDPSKYLLAIWTPGETATSFQPPERRCNFQEQDNFCNETTCFSCNSVREAGTKTVRGTVLIPCRTAMRGSFPLNGTYFQVNEVFADHETSLNPIYVPRNLLWKLQRRTVYFGTSISTIFRGLSTEGIQHCFWKGYVCVRGFDRRLRAPRPLVARLHFPASRMPRTSVKNDKQNLNKS
ncbi:hypothetical protein MLD38_020337 [Melastoma candidum]|uniref:Uncharacterized protein n=1 Tax=Melastoma candidum TaxID=119954 RepID=A0ACB9QCZ6_9MYRT|nr:hypothetical protein MLD38_020337 [Melastoma candidum]